jgi:D-threo-aldose 1-dehydrogenase
VTIERRELACTGVELTSLVLGCAPLGGLFAPVRAEDAAATLDAAWDAGIRAFDTAPHYGVGLAEERLGAALRSWPRSEVVVSSKVGRLLVPTDEDVDGAEGFFATPRRRRVRDYSRDGVRRSVEQSCERLGVDHLDIALVHDPDDHFDVARDEAIPALAELRGEGIVKAVGVGMNQTAMLERFVAETDIDCVLVAGRYSLLDASAAAVLFPACTARGVAVLAAGVFNSGILADPRPGATFDYVPASEPLVERAIAIRAICERRGVAIAAAALHYVLAHPAVSAVVVGARSAAEVTENARHLATPLPWDLFDELAAEGLLAAPVAGGPR